MNCDHLIGYGGDSDGGPLAGSERDRVAQACFRAKKQWLSISHKGRWPETISHVESLDTPEKALADTFDMFDFCPRCGEKLT